NLLRHCGRMPAPPKLRNFRRAAQMHVLGATLLARRTRLLHLGAPDRLRGVPACCCPRCEWSHRRESQLQVSRSSSPCHLLSSRIWLNLPVEIIGVLLWGAGCCNAVAMGLVGSGGIEAARRFSSPRNHCSSCKVFIKLTKWGASPFLNFCRACCSPSRST